MRSVGERVSPEASIHTRAMELIHCYSSIGPQFIRPANQTLRSFLTNISSLQSAISEFESEVRSVNARLQAGLSQVRCFERIQDLTLNIQPIRVQPDVADTDDLINADLLSRVLPLLPPPKLPKRPKKPSIPQALIEDEDEDEDEEEQIPSHVRAIMALASELRGSEEKVSLGFSTILPQTRLERVVLPEFEWLATAAKNTIGRMLFDDQVGQWGPTLDRCSHPEIKKAWEALKIQRAGVTQERMLGAHSPLPEATAKAFA